IAEAANRGIDDAPVALAQRLVREVQSFHHAGTKVLHHDLPGLDQLEEDLAACGTLEVERDGKLVAVDALEITAERPQPILGMERPDLACPVALQRLDLDHRGALVGEHHGAERAGQHLGEIDDAQPFECAAARGHLLAQWLRRLINVRRSPSNTIFSSWFTPQWRKCTMPASSRSAGATASTSVNA